MNRINKIMMIMLAIIMCCVLLSGITSAQIYNVNYARSLIIPNPHTETVVEIMNDAGIAINVQINWFDQLGNPVGISGPVNILPNCSRTFTTAAPAVPIAPYGIDVPRNPAIPFEGYGKIIVIPPGAALGIDATLIIDIDPITNLGANYKSIKVGI